MSGNNNSVKLNTVIIHFLGWFLFKNQAVTHSYRQKHKLWAVRQHREIDRGQPTTTVFNIIDHRRQNQSSIYLCDVWKETAAAVSKLMISVISREKPQMCISYCSEVQTIEASQAQ